MFKFIQGRRLFLVSMLSIVTAIGGGVWWKWGRAKSMEGLWIWSGAIRTEALVFSREGVVVLKNFSNSMNPALMDFSLESGIPGRYLIEGNDIFIRWSNRELPMRYEMQNDGNVLYPDDGHGGRERRLYVRESQFKTDAEPGDLDDSDKDSEARFLVALEKLNNGFDTVVEDTNAGRITADEAEKRIGEMNAQLDREFAQLPNQVSPNARERHSTLKQKLQKPEETVGPFISHRRAWDAFSQYSDDWKNGKFTNVNEAHAQLNRVGLLVDAFRKIYNIFKGKHGASADSSKWGRLLGVLQDGVVSRVNELQQEMDKRLVAEREQKRMDAARVAEEQKKQLPRATNAVFGGYVCPYKCSDGGWIFQGARSGDTVKCQKCGKPFVIP